MNIKSLNSFRFCFVNKNTSFVIATFEQPDGSRLALLEVVMFSLVYFKTNFTSTIHHKNHNTYIIKLIVDPFIFLITNRTQSGKHFQHKILIKWMIPSEKSMRIPTHPVFKNEGFSESF